MENNAELTILYDANNQPTSARCSACRELMPTTNQRTTSVEIINWFAVHFEIHKRHKHPVEQPVEPSRHRN
jgi:hypothetical protein